MCPRARPDDRPLEQSAGPRSLPSVLFRSTPRAKRASRRPSESIRDRRAPDVRGVRSALPPDLARRSRCHVVRRERAVAGGVPLGRQGGVRARERALLRNHPMRAIRALRLTACAIANTGPPLVFRVRRAAPPAHACGPDHDVLGRDGAVSLRVPLGCDPRTTSREIVCTRYSSIGAEGTAAPACAIVRLRAPHVVAALCASPPDHPRRATADRLRRQRTVALGVPLFDQMRIAGDPIARPVRIGRTHERERRTASNPCARTRAPRASARGESPGTSPCMKARLSDTL
jgi:hypothetical protein